MAYDTATKKSYRRNLNKSYEHDKKISNTKKHLIYFYLNNILNRIYYFYILFL